MKTESGFKPTKAISKLLGIYGNYAYIYNDGVIVVEKKEIKLAKDTYKTVELWHAIPCETRIRVVDYAYRYESGKGIPQVRCLVVHDGRLIANGFDRVEVQFNVGSLGTKEKSLVINAVKFSLGNHEWRTQEISENRTIIFGSGITIQPNPYDHWSSRLEDYQESISDVVRDITNRNYSVIVYGDLPKEEMKEQKLLSVS